MLLYSKITTIIPINRKSVQWSTKCINNICAIQVDDLLSHCFANQFQQRFCTADEKCLEIIRPERCHVDDMGPEVFVQHTGLHIGALDRLEVFAWRLAAQLPVGSVGDGRLVDNAVPFAPVITLLFAVFLGENVMDIYGACGEISVVHLIPTDEVTRPIVQDKRHDPFVRRPISGLQGEQPGGLEKCTGHRIRLAAPVQPGQNAGYIIGIAGFVGRTI